MGLVNGKVGIGTTDPQEALHINGAIRGNVAGALRINTGTGYLDIGPQNTNWAHFMTGNAAFYFNKPIYSDNGVFSSYNTSNLFLQTGGTTRLTLEAAGSAKFSGDIYTPYGSRITIGSYSAAGNARLSMTQNTVHGYIDYKDNLHFRTDQNWISSLTLYGNGSVGVGFSTTYNLGDYQTLGGVDYQTQGFKFAVNGGILCEKIKVIADVPSSDFVFEEDYKLKSLAETEAFVKKHKHLPEIPSAADFKKNGYSVGEMDNLLLRKVEELTLYMIEMKKENQDLQNRLVQLEKKN